MSNWGCSLDDAFGQETIKIRKKKKNIKMISPDKLQLENLDSKFNDSHIQPNDPTNSEGAELAGRETKQKEEKEHVHKVHEQSQGVEISNEEYQAFKEYQKQRYLHSQERVFEGFRNMKQYMDDDFNDVLLFGLTGIFFLIFIDYIYKLGKKSY
tara:strand:- start:1845 stop:2306 length:462 start_codon:yes stop_codon:yes gene_type:complete